ncbi:hypothetical protein [Mumia zhuanghuii]|nr:hypothetical protein [Mumia zhuanghuii]
MQLLLKWPVLQQFQKPAVLVRARLKWQRLLAHMLRPKARVKQRP